MVLNFHLSDAKKDLTTSHLWEDALSCKRWPSFVWSFLIVKLSLSSVQNSCRIGQWLYHDQMIKALEWPGPHELKKISYNIFFELMVLLAIHGRFFLIFSFQLLIISSSLWLKHVHPGFITRQQVRNNPTITAFVCFQKFPGTFKVLCLLLLSEQMRFPPSANLSQVQTLFQNCLHTAVWYASTTSYIFDRQSGILFDHNLYSSDVSLGNRGFRPSRTGSSSIVNFPALKVLTHLKTNCAH